MNDLGHNCVAQGLAGMIEDADKATTAMRAGASDRIAPRQAAAARGPRYSFRPGPCLWAQRAKKGRGSEKPRPGERP